MSIVIYAKDSKRLASFYERVLGLRREEEDTGFVLLGSQSLELAIVQASQTVSEQIEITSPPSVRLDTPMKPSFAVINIEGCRAAIESGGGGLKPQAAAWTWLGAVHLNGWDPEGNVIQLRQSDA